MAEKIVSPGVFTRENDISFLSQGVGDIGAAVIGPFKKGPVFLPTVVNTQSEFEELFGTPDGTYYTGYTVQNYLREAGAITIVRVGHSDGYTHTAPLAIAVSGSKIVATLFATTASDQTAGFSGSTISANTSSSDFSITVTGSSAISSSILPSSANDIDDVFGSSAQGPKSTYSYNYFQKASIDADLESNGGVLSIIQLPSQVFESETLIANTPWIQSQDISGDRYSLFKFHTLGAGTTYNKEYKIGISNVKVPVLADGSYTFPTFTITVREYSDTDKRPVVKETFAGVNLNPASANYISKTIGDLNTTIDSTGKMNITGDFANNSNHIRVEVAAEGSYPIAAGPFAHAAYTNPIYASTDDSLVPGVIFSTGSFNNTSTVSSKYSGIDLETATVKIDNNSYLVPIPQNSTIGANTVFSFDGAMNAISGGAVTSVNAGYSLTGSNLTDVNKRQFIVGFQNGFDGISPIVTSNLGSDIVGTNSQGFDLNTSTSTGSIDYVRAINSVSNPDDFDVNLISAPGVIRRLHSYVFDYVVEMVETREDAFFIGDVTSENDTIAQAVAQGSSVDSNYTGTYYPWVKTIDVNTNKLTSVPPSVLMPGIYAANDKIAAEWWAPAGLNRGGIVGAVSVLNRLTHSERDELYEGKINPIASFPGEGIVAFGQKTLQEASSALDRINVRRLLIKVKKYIASTSRYLVFEQNTATTRSKFLNTVNPYLEGIQQRQGLYTFKVVMDETNNTPDVIDRNILVGQIFLQPTRTAEFIVLDFSILPTGASFSS